MSAQVTLEPAPEEPPRLRGWSTRRIRLAGLATGVVLALVAGLLVIFLRHDSKPASAVPAQWIRPTVDEAGLAQRSGVKVTQVAVTGGGGLVDLRFQVVNPSVAGALHNEDTPPAVVEEESGLVVHELFMGHAHTDPFKAGQTYYFIFNDPVNWVHRGGKVTVLLGDAQLEHVVVR